MLSSTYAAATRRLVGARGPGKTCGVPSCPGEESVYLPMRGNVIGFCSKLSPTKSALERLRAVWRRASSRQE